MNREEKRLLINKLKRKGMNKADAEFMVLMEELSREKKTLKNGDKVKIDVQAMKSSKEYTTLNPRLKEWIEEHQDEVFTTFYEKNQNIYQSTVCFVEDKSEPRWKFWEHYLIKVAK